MLICPEVPHTLGFSTVCNLETCLYVWLKLICDRTREQFCSFQRQRKFINCSANSCLPEMLENWKPWSI